MAVRQLLFVNVIWAWVSIVLLSLVVLYLAAGLFFRKSALYFLPLGAVATLLLFLEFLIRAAISGGFSPLPSALIRPAFKGNQFQIPLFDGPAAIADSISGYRWSSNPVNVMKIGNNTIEYVNTLRGNNLGFHAHRQFESSKREGIYRIAVLGDSFTDAYFLKTPWPEQWERNLQEEDPNIEVLSFGINGGGIVNWHRMFFKLLLPEFEMDALVLAVFGNDLTRDFFSMHHHEGSVHLKYYKDTPPQDLKEDLLDFPGIDCILDPTRWRQVLAIYQPELRGSSPTFMIYNVLVNLTSNFIKNIFHSESNDNWLREHVYPSSEPVNDAFLSRKYGKKLMLLDEILLTCKARGIKVFLFCVPEEKGAIISRSGVTPQIASELTYISKRYDAQFWNGYQPYNELTPVEIRSHFMHPDGHWNQKGSDFFASRLPCINIRY